MDNVPFAFIDSVAHLVPTNSLFEVSQLANIWKRVGRTHKSKRIDYRITIYVQGDQISYILSGFRFGYHYKVAKLLKTNLHFARINAVFVRRNVNAREPEHDLGLLRKLLSSCLPVQRLNLTEESLSELLTGNLEALEFVWKLPVQSLQVSQYCPGEIIQFHLFQNQNLKEVTIRRASYNVVHRLMKSWEQERMVKVEIAGKALDELSGLGFSTNTYLMSHWPMARTVQNSSGRQISFRVFPY
ncbi:hypothetical protein L596_025866 [Steinernema carpocapsae]|uniref:F-box domain-containing protein n=1 Tax=Steinernema carpocapsae TaxID=34508 RepID=A0A4U5M991_STECR|nr:hypothetical protein L596_025866 [Steinernema carpocapsae]